MSEIHQIKAGRSKIAFRLRRVERRTLAITVQPDLEVLVVAPKGAALETVLVRVRRRARWIRRQQQYFSEFLPSVPPRQFVSGETHRYLGRQYRLKIVEGKSSKVKLQGRFLWVHVLRPPDIACVRKCVQGWYHRRAKERLTRSYGEAAARLGSRLKILPGLRVRRMRKRWGSWTQRSGVCLNSELIKAPPSCIEYVVTHELCHAVHGNHSRKFYDLLRRVMPDWQLRKARLERSMAN